MEPIKSSLGIECALRAAFQTSRTPVETEVKAKEEKNPMCSALMAWPAKFLKEKLVPFYRRTRASCKRHMTSLLYGNSPYACRIHATGINLLVLCSFIYLFLEVVSLSFFGPDTDFAFAIVAVYVHPILTVLEIVIVTMIVIVIMMGNQRVNKNTTICFVAFIDVESDPVPSPTHSLTHPSLLSFHPSIPKSPLVPFPSFSVQYCVGYSGARALLGMVNPKPGLPRTDILRQSIRAVDIQKYQCLSSYL